MIKTRPTRRPRRLLLELTPAGMDTATASANRMMQNAIGNYIDLAGDAQEGAEPCIKAQAAAAGRYFAAAALLTSAARLTRLQGN